MELSLTRPLIGKTLSSISNSVVVLALLTSSATPVLARSTAPVAVLTQHNDLARTGAI
jgi:hypothetical protein